MNKLYKIQDGCHNCSHCYITAIYGELDYSCNLDKNRPLNNLEASEQFQKNKNKKSYIKNLDTWDAWLETNKVSESGICNYYFKK